MTPWAGFVALTFGLMLTTPTAWQYDDLAPAIVALHSTMDAGDVDDAANLFADDGVVVQPRVAGLPEIFVGRSQIEWWLRSLVAQHVQLQLTDGPDTRDAAGHLTWSDALGVDAYRQLGIDRLPVECDAELDSDGRIESQRIELTPAAARLIQSAPGTPQSFVAATE